MNKEAPSEYIELNAFLKKMNLATSGGAAKQIIRSGIVFLNGEKETRNKKKLYVGDIVKIEDQVFEITET